eukprot:scaffold87927_cov60-Phaeocystis_antarctica.AAC.2
MCASSWEVKKRTQSANNRGDEGYRPLAQFAACEERRRRTPSAMVAPCLLALSGLALAGRPLVTPRTRGAAMRVVSDVE